MGFKSGHTNECSRSQEIIAGSQLFQGREEAVKKQGWSFPWFSQGGDSYLTWGSRRETKFNSPWISLSKFSLCFVYLCSRPAGIESNVRLLKTHRCKLNFLLPLIFFFPRGNVLWPCQFLLFGASLLGPHRNCTSTLTPSIYTLPSCHLEWDWALYIIDED